MLLLCSLLMPHVPDLLYVHVPEKGISLYCTLVYISEHNKPELGLFFSRPSHFLINGIMKVPICFYEAGIVWSMVLWRHLDSGRR